MSSYGLGMKNLNILEMSPPLKDIFWRLFKERHTEINIFTHVSGDLRVFNVSS